MQSIQKQLNTCRKLTIRNFKIPVVTRLNVCLKVTHGKQASTLNAFFRGLY